MAYLVGRVAPAASGRRLPAPATVIVRRHGAVMTDHLEGSRLQMSSRILILAGVAVWAVYGLCMLGGAEPAVGWFLPFHLAGVIPGVVLSRWGTMRRWLGRGSAV